MQRQEELTPADRERPAHVYLLPRGCERSELCRDAAHVPLDVQRAGARSSVALQLSLELLQLGLQRGYLRHEVVLLDLRGRRLVVRGRSAALLGHREVGEGRG